MIEILGVKLSYEALIFIAAFAASEIIGESKLKENSLLALAKKLIDALRPHRTEDETVTAIKEKAEELIEEVKSIGE